MKIIKDSAQNNKDLNFKNFLESEKSGKLSNSRFLTLQSDSGKYGVVRKVMTHFCKEKH